MSPRGDRTKCAEFQAKMPNLIGSGGDIAGHPHLKECASCRKLLTELETIAQAARDLFPDVEPPEEVWGKIESTLKGRKPRK